MIVIAVDPLWKHLESIKRQFSIAIIALNFFSRKFFLLFFQLKEGVFVDLFLRGKSSAFVEQCFSLALETG